MNEHVLNIYCKMEHKESHWSLKEYLTEGLALNTCCFYEVYFLVQNTLEAYLMEE